MEVVPESKARREGRTQFLNAMLWDYIKRREAEKKLNKEIHDALETGRAMRLEDSPKLQRKREREHRKWVREMRRKYPNMGKPIRRSGKYPGGSAKYAPKNSS